MTAASQYRLRGLGQTSQQILGYGTTAAQAGATIAMTTTTLGTTVQGLLGLSSAAAAVPIVGAAIAGISMAIEAILNSGCGQTCIVTSQWANQAEQYLQQNISQYFAIPAPRPASVQQIALANFQAIWNQLVKLCSQPGTGNAGVRCITDRQAGACTWKATTPQYPGGPAAGTCWNWWNGYHDPIANDPNVVADVASSVTSAAANVVSTLTGGSTVTTGSGLTPVLLIGGAVLLFAMLAS